MKRQAGDQQLWNLIPPSFPARGPGPISVCFLGVFSLWFPSVTCCPLSAKTPGAALSLKSAACAVSSLLVPAPHPGFALHGCPSHPPQSPNTFASSPAPSGSQKWRNVGKSRNVHRHRLVKGAQGTRQIIIIDVESVSFEGVQSSRALRTKETDITCFGLGN